MVSLLALLCLWSSCACAILVSPDSLGPIGGHCWVDFIGVLRHMQRYFSHICDGTDVQADWRSCTYGRAPNAIDISQGSLMCPSYIGTGPPFLYGDSDTPSHLVAFYDTLGIRRTYSRLKHPPPPGVLTVGGVVRKDFLLIVSEE